MPTFWPLTIFRRRRDAEAMAGAAIAVFGADAYDVARICAGPRGARKCPYWSRVAVRIAELSNREIGVTGADRRRRP